MTTPAVPLMSATCPGDTTPAPSAEAELSEQPLATGVPSARPVTRAASRVIVPATEAQGRISGMSAGGSSNRRKRASDQRPALTP